VTIAVVAEKPAVARDLARVLGARTRGDGRYHGNGYVVTWAIGHLVRLAEPQEMDERLRRWRLGDLPILPEKWPLVVLPATRDQFENVRTIVNDREVEEIVCATDAGREGELIFRYVYEAARCRKPIKRLWLSSLTDDAIARGFRELRDGRAFEPLARAARARARADWLVGMNFSRAYSVTHDEMFSVGRVQTPTLAMVVARELEIRAFVPEEYLEIVATFRSHDPPGEYRGVLLEGARPARPDAESAAKIVARAAGGAAKVASVKREKHVLPPPQLYDLTELQRHANRLFGMSAQRTLDVAQALYEKRLLSYPRTDSRFLSTTVAATLPAIVSAIAPAYAGMLAPGSGTHPLGRRFVDDARVSDHHAILPLAAAQGLSRDEQRIHDLVCRRLLAAWHEDHLTSSTNLVTEVTSEGALDRFGTRGTSVERVGWKVLDLASARQETPLPNLAVGAPVDVAGVKSVAKKTQPPPRYTDATLLTAMESAGRTIEEKEVSEAMRNAGLGTPATRAATIETLLRREYIVREGKSFAATARGIALIAAVHPRVKSPVLTGEWEREIRALEKGEGDARAFMDRIASFVTEVVGEVAAPQPTVHAPTNITPESLRGLLGDAFGFASFRPYQADVCAAVASGRDVLLVMPTGSGKSLCYQLPGVARGGVTLVVSPLIALMEDQVAKLRAHGLAADRIHSGRDRASSRAACRAYLDGSLRFLFIAPERLKVPGFPEMLARRKPTLVAIDEAHCISHWGHDFRPDYRMLGERLPLLRPAPVIALTATATPEVQTDILAQLGLVDAARFIHGFRRENLAIEVLEKSPDARIEAASAILEAPAIVYAPTRALTEEAARALATPSRRTAAYHAGMPGAERDAVQRAFQEGRLDVVVATIAFGMGVDKADIRTVIHCGLPATLEGYYQEIGRAGRDGRPARAVLFESAADLKTHEYFLEKNYPDSAVLAAVASALSARAQTKEALAARLGLDDDVFENALAKLWLHGGALVAPDGSITRGEAPWRKAYEAQRRHRARQIDQMAEFARRRTCRMLQIVRHFGDEKDSGAPCGVCDICAPDKAMGRRLRAPTVRERAAQQRLVRALGERGSLTVGQIHKDVFSDGSLDRPSLEHLLAAMARANKIAIEDAEFEKDGRTIPFQRVRLAGDRRSSSASPRRRRPRRRRR
jgi:DNA topoisomerase-3